MRRGGTASTHVVDDEALKNLKKHVNAKDKVFFNTRNGFKAVDGVPFIPFEQ